MPDDYVTRDEFEKRMSEVMKLISDIEKSKRGKLFKPPTLEEAKEYAEQKKLIDFDVETWLLARETAGWIMRSGVKIKNWKMDMLKMNREGYYRVNKNGIGSDTKKYKTDVERRNEAAIDAKW